MFSYDLLEQTVYRLVTVADEAWIGLQGPLISDLSSPVNIGAPFDEFKATFQVFLKV